MRSVLRSLWFTEWATSIFMKTRSLFGPEACAVISCYSSDSSRQQQKVSFTNLSMKTQSIHTSYARLHRGHWRRLVVRQTNVSVTCGQLFGGLPEAILVFIVINHGLTHWCKSIDPVTRDPLHLKSLRKILSCAWNYCLPLLLFQMYINPHGIRATKKSNLRKSGY